MLKCIIANRGYTIGNGDGGQTTAIVEGRTAYIQYTIGDSHGGQSTAAKSIIAYGCHAVRNDYGY